MSVALTQLDREGFRQKSGPSRWVSTRNVAFTGAMPAGGEVVSAKALGLARITRAEAYVVTSDAPYVRISATVAASGGQLTLTPHEASATLDGATVTVAVAPVATATVLTGLVVRLTAYGF